MASIWNISQLGVEFAPLCNRCIRETWLRRAMNAAITTRQNWHKINTACTRFIKGMQSITKNGINDPLCDVYPVITYSLFWWKSKLTFRKETRFYKKSLYWSYHAMVYTRSINAPDVTWWDDVKVRFSRFMTACGLLQERFIFKVHIYFAGMNCTPQLHFTNLQHIRNVTKWTRCLVRI